jgi:hypothetical protein
MRAPSDVMMMIAIIFGMVPRVDGNEQATAIGPGPHLFVDDMLVASRAKLIRRAHACYKLDKPVLRAEQPWEEQRAYVYGSARRDRRGSRFELWYMSHGTDRQLHDPRLQPRSDLIMFATSRDGVGWTRPNLRQFAFDGDYRNNIVFSLHSPSLLFDRDETDPTYRYKMVGHCKGGYRAAFSPDGLHWTFYPKNPIILGSDTITLSYNPKTREYLAFFKRNIEIRGSRRRTVHLATSKDMQDWREEGLVMAADKEDDRWVKKAPERTDFYNMSVFPSGEQFLGLVTVFKLQRIQKPQPGQSPHDGPIDVQLVHSRDARHWSRCDDRSPVIPRGPHPYDAGSILGVSNIPIIHNDQMWIYYTAMTTPHGGALPEKKMSVGRAAWRLDGMVSLDAGDAEGWLEMRPLRTSGRQLILNADASKGRLVVDLLDREGRPLSGYSADDCVAIDTDSVRHRVRWTGQEKLPADAPVRLRFRLRNTSLYSFKITD